MPRGASAQREREYEELVDEFEEEGRYPGREEEVAARIVNKQRADHGETQAAKAQDRRGQSPDRHLPIPNYDRMTVEEASARLDGLSERELKSLRTYEQHHQNRKTMIAAIERHLV